MTTGVEAPACGLLHEAAVYEGDEQFLAVAVPFLQGGLDAGEPTVVSLDDSRIDLVRSAMTASKHLSFVSGERGRPANVLKSVNQLLAGYLAQGARQIRILGDVPHPGVGVPWEWWARYEATVNHAFANFPLWSLCPYDRRITSAEVLDDVAQTHPYLATPDGRHVVNERYTDPAVFLSQPRSALADPLETSPPAIDLVDPSASAARRAVLGAAPRTRLSEGEVADLVIAVSETVTNAHCHGDPPTQLRVWPAPDRMVVTVTDQGNGPTDPFAGLLPAAKAPAGGLGLWMAHQLCNLVTFDNHANGFTVRLIAGDPYLPA
jgi:anti-sigma regulatory factor (Ser/Thr protein kinase)